MLPLVRGETALRRTQRRTGRRALKEMLRKGRPGFWRPLLSVTGGLVLERLAEVGGVGVWAKCCALEHVLHTRPRAGHSAMTVPATPGRL